MQSDKVSTPDILGILAGQRIEEALTELDAETDTTAAADRIFSKLDEGRDLFLREVAPLLMSGRPGYGAKIDPNSLSADQVMQDDESFERFMLSRLRTHLKPGQIPGTFSLRTPREFQGRQVTESYPCLTFRRTVAIQYPARDVEFVTRLHPLFQAMAQDAHRQVDRRPAIPMLPRLAWRSADTHLRTKAHTPCSPTSAKTITSTGSSLRLPLTSPERRSRQTR